MVLRVGNVIASARSATVDVATGDEPTKDEMIRREKIGGKANVEEQLADSFTGTRLALAESYAYYFFLQYLLKKAFTPPSAKILTSGEVFFCISPRHPWRF